MITLFQFPSIWGLPNPSSFCVKIETYLRLSQIPYVVKDVRDPRRAPKGKLPFIRDGEKTIADSSFIIDYLKATYGDKLDYALTAQQKALALAVQRLVEEHLYWIGFYGRWAPEYVWKTVKDVYFYKMPAPLKWFVPQMIRKSCIKQTYAQGIGRLTDEERLQSGKADIDALCTLLNDQPFFFGDKPTSIDCSVWGLVTNLLNAPIKNDLADYAKTYQQLVDYDSRMRFHFDELRNIRQSR